MAKSRYLRKESRVYQILELIADNSNSIPAYQLVSKLDEKFPGLSPKTWNNIISRAKESGFLHCHWQLTIDGLAAVKTAIDTMVADKVPEVSAEDVMATKYRLGENAPSRKLLELLSQQPKQTMPYKALKEAVIALGVTENNTRLIIFRLEKCEYIRRVNMWWHEIGKRVVVMTITKVGMAALKNEHPHPEDSAPAPIVEAKPASAPVPEEYPPLAWVIPKRVATRSKEKDTPLTSADDIKITPELVSKNRLW